MWQAEKESMPATLVPDVRSKALYTLENAPLRTKTVSEPTRRDWVKVDDALSFLFNEFEAFKTLVSRQFFHRLTLLPDNLFNFACELLRLFSSCGLRLRSLLLFLLGLGLDIRLLTALRL